MGSRNNSVFPKGSFNNPPLASKTPHLGVDAALLRIQFDREPFEFVHDLQTLPLFSLDCLTELAARFTLRQRDFFVAEGAPEPGTPFYSVRHGGVSPLEAIQQLHSRSLRVLLKRPENHDSRFRRLLDGLFGEVLSLHNCVKGAKILRLESAVLITSAATITPLHFDPEVGFFSQIAGEKIYHVYSPTDMTEPELERFYIGGVVDIGRIEMAKRNPAREQVYTLAAGRGFHQPQNSPHWVETGNGQSISYTFVLETDLSRARGRTRAFNYYQRRLGLSPSSPGDHRPLDVSKAAVMRAVIPVRQLVGATLRRAHAA